MGCLGPLERWQQRRNANWDQAMFKLSATVRALCMCSEVLFLWLLVWNLYSATVF